MGCNRCLSKELLIDAVRAGLSLVLPNGVPLPSHSCLESIWPSSEVQSTFCTHRQLSQTHTVYTQSFKDIPRSQGFLVQISGLHWHNKRYLNKGVLYCLMWFFFFLAVLEFELRASHVLGRCSITWATLPALICVEMKAHENGLRKICIESWDSVIAHQLELPYLQFTET
jgi:hypothetical protein